MMTISSGATTSRFLRACASSRSGSTWFGRIFDTRRSSAARSPRLRRSFRWRRAVPWSAAPRRAARDRLQQGGRRNSRSSAMPRTGPARAFARRRISRNTIMPQGESLRAAQVNARNGKSMTAFAKKYRRIGQREFCLGALPRLCCKSATCSTRLRWCDHPDSGNTAGALAFPTAPQDAASGIKRRLAELFFDADQLVVLGEFGRSVTSEPVFICPQLVATARSAIVESSVSPERCDITAP